MSRYKVKYWDASLGLHTPFDDGELYGCEITDTENGIVGTTHRARSSKTKAYDDAWEDLMKKQKDYYSDQKANSTESYAESTSSDQSGCTKMIIWLVGIGVAIFVIVWLAVNVVLPVALLNSALALTVSAFVFKKYKKLFASLALVGGGYMLLDITKGWLSITFVDNVVKNPDWISAFVYINAVAIGISVWLLVLPLWLKTEQIDSLEKRKSLLLKITLILLVTFATAVVPVIYHTVQNPFIQKTIEFVKGDEKLIDKSEPIVPVESVKKEEKIIDKMEVPTSDTQILTLMSPTYSFGDLPHLTFKDFKTHKEEEYECDWDLPAIKEIMTKCEDYEGCPALKGQVYSATLKLKLLDAVEYNVESGAEEPTGKKENRWVMVALQKIN